MTRSRSNVARLALVAVLVASGSAAAAPPPPDAALLRLAITRGDSTTYASSLLVRRDVVDGKAMLYFVTAADLFRGGRGEPLAATSLVVELPAGRVAIRPQHVSLPIGTLLNIAVLKAETDADMPTPRPATITLRRPEAGELFVVSGFTRSGASITSTQRTSWIASLAITGSQPVPGGDCAGAAALRGSEVFGLVSACTAERPPVVLPFAIAANWLRRTIPGGLPAPGPVFTGFEWSERQVPGPLLSVPCGESTSGEIDVPFALAPDEAAAIDARASVTRPRSIRLADVSVVRLTDSVVTLRFTLTGQPPLRYEPPKPCPPAQALVSIQLDVVKKPVR